MPDVRYIAVEPFECQCVNNTANHICISCAQTHKPLCLKNISPNLQWMYVIDDINTPEYYIDGVIFTSYADVCAFVERFEIVRPYLNMPEYFCGFTINGKFFFNNIGEIESLVKQIAPITHPFWTDLLGDLDELSFIIKENTKSYHVAASHDETIEDSMYGTYCISCNTSTTMKPRSVMIFENNYIVLCESCADNQLIIRKCD